LSEYTAYNKIEELKEALKNKTLPPYQTHYMSAWCHGAPGIGLARLRAYQLTGNEIYASESRNIVSATIKSLNIPHGNYSSCHGLFGNAETLLNVSRIFNDPELSLIV
jgi:lantibiotic biosynthesis protein